MSKALATKNVAAIVLAFAMIVGFAFSFATPAKADMMSDLQAQVQALLAQISALQGGSSAPVSGAGCYTFTQSLKKGSTGGEVMWVQKFLNSHGAQVAASGAGSPGNETSTFGPATAAAVKKFQELHAADVLTPVGLTAGTGNWGPSTRAKANALCAGSTGGTTGGGTTVPMTGNVMVSGGVQPANSLAPASSVRVPFTTFTITNGSGAAVTINGVKVQRTGLAQDVNFTGVVLVDSNGLQVGNSQTLNSDHMATIGGTWTIPAGASQTFTVAGNIAAAATAKSGEVASLSVVGVDTAATVGGSLPITGASHTINTTLAIGTLTIGTSPEDPSSATNKNIGDTGIKFSAVRFTAGSGEDLKLFSVRWRLNGSASSADIGNVVTVVNGTTYPTVLSSDGRYYTSTFPGGIMVAKGMSVDVLVKGDVVGNNAAARTVIFDIDRTSDVYFVGQTYGYGIALPTSSTGGTYDSTNHSTSGFNTASQPWFTGAKVTVQAGTVTTIQNASSVAAQNIPTNVPNTVLGGFITNFAGEAVTVSGMTFYLTTAGTGGITNVSLVDQNGAVVAGPVDASFSGTNGVVTFTSNVTFPVGSRTYTIKGKLGNSGFTNGQTVQASTTPSAWSSPVGQTSGNTITISTGNFTMAVMTVRTGSLAITAASSPASASVVRPATNVRLANIQLDASQSGEDMRISNLILKSTGTAQEASLSGCQLWDGTTALNTGSNAVNTVSTTTTVTFDNSLTITKGTVKTLGWSCNIAGTANSGSTYIWGVNSGNTITATGVQSGSSFTITPTTGASGTMTLSTGASVTITVDSSSPSYAVQAGGATGVTLGVFKIRSANEALNLTKIGLQLGSGAAADLGTVSLYNGSTLLGTATFTGSNTNATSTLSSPFTVAQDTDVLITVKGDLAMIGTGQPGTQGQLVKVEPTNQWEGTGVSSGSVVNASGSAGVAGVRTFKSFPTVALDTLSSTGVADGRLIRFKVTADSHGPVGIWEFPFNVATTTLSVTNFALYGYTDSSYSQAISGQDSGGQIGATISATSTSFIVLPTTNPVQVPAGSTYYFELRGSVSGVTSGASAVTKLLGDTTYNGLAQAAQVAGNFVWSANATTTSSTSHADWSNGASIPGLSSSGIIQTRSN